MVAPIDIDPDLDQGLLARAKEAANRWKVREPVRVARREAIEKGDYLSADSPARLALRVNTLLDNVRRASRNRRPPADPNLRDLAESPIPVTVADLSNDLVNEVVLGARNFLSVEFLERGLQATMSVGRILINRGGAVRPRGTGFFVAPGLLLTNEHVLTSAQLAAACSVEMDYEQNWFGTAKQVQVFRLEPQRFFLNNHDLDYALVAVAPRSERGADVISYGWLPLISAQGKIAMTGTDYINVVQHPLGREKEVVLRDNRVLDLRTDSDQGAEVLGPFLHYEADTEKGSSGSPVLNDQWEVIALHHSGVPATDSEGRWLGKDGQPWRESEQPVSDIQWIANEGVRVSSLVASVTAAQVKPHEQELLQNLISAQPPMAVGMRSEAEEQLGGETSSTAPSQAGTSRGPSSRPGVAWSGSAEPAAQSSTAVVEFPLRITVSIGEGSVIGRTSVAGDSGGRPEELLEAISAADFADREGFDREFLGVEVPLPTAKPQPRFGGLLRIARPARPGDRNELRYHRHSILMCADRRLAYVSACNIDFGAPAMASRSDGRKSWLLDPRIDRDDQLGNSYYAGNDYDKGHLTRRDDAAWGANLEEAIAANDDTFFYPNSAPQHFLFNQADEFTQADLDLWGDLENYISQQGGPQRARLNLFNGPVFGDGDRPLKDALVPLSYYKIVVWRDGDAEPGAVGFLLHQDDLIRNVPEEAIDPGRFSIRQRRIAEIEAMLDLDFGPVTGWDVMPAPAPEEAFDEEGPLITSVADIRLGVRQG